MKPFKGAWVGQLTYLDYSSGEPYTMPVELVITSKGNGRDFLMDMRYPDEPQANGLDTLLLSADGSMMDDEHVLSLRKEKGGATEIITEERGTDGNDEKPATFRHTYTASKTTMTFRKDVMFDGTTTWIKRHEYSFTRKQ